MTTTRLPSPYFERARDDSHAFLRLRICRVCGHPCLTAEVALAGSWTGQKADHCPLHHDEKGRVLYLHAQTSGGKSSLWAGKSMALSLGAIYRRRRCPRPGCSYNTGKPTRWTTLEVFASGLMEGHVSLCQRCGGKMDMRRFWAGDLPSMRGQNRQDTTAETEVEE